MSSCRQMISKDTIKHESLNTHIDDLAGLLD